MEVADYLHQHSSTISDGHFPLHSRLTVMNVNQRLVVVVWWLDALLSYCCVYLTRP